jgi:hypothetical protein
MKVPHWFTEPRHTRKYAVKLMPNIISNQHTSVASSPARMMVLKRKAAMRRFLLRATLLLPREVRETGAAPMVRTLLRVPRVPRVPKARQTPGLRGITERNSRSLE